MKNFILLLFMLILPVYFTGCSGGSGDRAQPIAENSSPKREEHSQQEPAKTPSPGLQRQCDAVIKNCQLFNLNDEELSMIREQVLVVIPPDMTEGNYPGMKLVIARVHVLLDFISTYYAHAVMELKSEEKELYIKYFESIQWK